MVISLLVGLTQKSAIVYSADSDSPGPLSNETPHKIIWFPIYFLFLYNSLLSVRSFSLYKCVSRVIIVLNWRKKCVHHLLTSLWRAPYPSSSVFELLITHFFFLRTKYRWITSANGFLTAYRVWFSGPIHILKNTNLCISQVYSIMNEPEVHHVCINDFHW